MQNDFLCSDAGGDVISGAIAYTDTQESRRFNDS